MIEYNPATFKRRLLNDGIIYGYLYNHYVATDPNIGNSGFRVPDVSDSTDLEVTLAYTDTGDKLKSRRQDITPLTAYQTTVHPYWINAPSNYYGTDIVNFGAVPGGARTSGFSLLGDQGIYWLSDILTGNGYRITFSNSSRGMSYNTNNRFWGFSLRLVRDLLLEDPAIDGEYASNYIGNDGKEYKTVKIGNRVWLAENLAETISPNRIYNLDVPVGWRLPTEAEWETERLSWVSNDSAGAFASPLKLTVTGYRAYGNGSFGLVGSYGYYWSSTIDSTKSLGMTFSSIGANLVGYNRPTGISVRLIKESGLPLIAGDQSFTYNGASWTYQEVESAGRVWMDRNLGATQVASASADSAAYGGSFQWGRNIDGHQVRTSGTTATLSNSDTPGHGNFITTSAVPYDWRDPQNDDLWQLYNEEIPNITDQGEWGSMVTWARCAYNNDEDNV